MINRICLIGVGLINGSLALALKTRGAIQEVVGVGRNLERLTKAKQQGIIDRGMLLDDMDLRDIDAVVIGVPVGETFNIVKQLTNKLLPKTILTDVGSTKQSVISAVQKALSQLPANFVPAHPIAGKEKNGFECATAELFEKKRVIITPLSVTDAGAIAQVRELWQRTGAVVEQMDPARHDDILALTSHLPHTVAYSLVHSLISGPDGKELLRYAAGGFADFTRIASSDVTMWKDICLENTNSILKAMDNFKLSFDELYVAIKNHDAKTIENLLARAKAARDEFISKK